jgi:HlyD family secretion protein
MGRDTFEKRRRRARIFWIAAVVIAAALVGIGMMPRPAEVEVAVIDRGEVRLDLVDEGRTRMHDIYTVSAPVSGRVLRLDVEPGDAVKKDEVIARMTQAAAGFLDTRSDLAARAAVEATEASLRAAIAEHELARREHERIEALAQRGLVAQSSVDTARARLDATVAARDAARAELARARSSLLPPDRQGDASTVIRAPVDGRVLTVPQKSENVVAAGSPLITIGDPSHIEVVAEFLSQDAVRMQPGSPALIENWGGPPLAATVERIEPVARMKVSALGVEEQRTNVILQFDDPAEAARFGHDFRVDARVTIESAPDAVRAPLGALFRQGAGWAVYRLVDGRAVLTPVETGIADIDYRQVTAGLEPGDTVIVFPGDTVSNGLRVKPRGQ